MSQSGDGSGLGPPSPAEPDRRLVVSALGLTQILAFGSTYYLPAVLARPIAEEMGWPLSLVVGGLSLGLVVSGLVSPKVGRLIQARGGRPVLAASSALIGLGLMGLALASSLPLYLAGWLIIGLGMGAGLYDAAFATLGRLYGQRARGSIAAVTLFGGFASTLCWPLSAFLLQNFGWRGACLAYAAIQLLFALPLHWLALRRATGVPGVSSRKPDRASAAPLLAPGEVPSYRLLAGVIALASAISATISVHLLTMLEAKDLTLAAAVALGAMIGPAQVSARAVEMAFGRYYHPVWTLLASMGLMALGLILLLSELGFIAVALIVYGAGLGIESIARGTLPLALFNVENYAALMGRIALPSYVAQALAPSLAAILIDSGGAIATLAALCGLAAVNVVATACLWLLIRPGLGTRA